MKNEYHGYGILKTLKGFEFYGIFKNSKREGRGYEKFPDGCEYFGQFKNSMMHGDGIF